MINPNKREDDSNKDADVSKEFVIRIAKIQDLPEEVVIKFLEAKGSLSSTKFGKQFLDEHK